MAMSWRTADGVLRAVGLIQPLSIATLILVFGVLFLISEIRNISQVNSTPPPSTLAVGSQTHSASPATIAAISELNLFGKTPVAQPLDAANLPATQLNLKLTGVFASTTAAHSRALITDGSSSAKAYFIGDELTNGAKLRSIDDEFIVIERAGQLEKLELHKSSGGNNAPQRRTAPALAQTSEAPPTVLPQPTSGITPDNVYQNLQDRLATIRNTNGSAPR